MVSLFIFLAFVPSNYAQTIDSLSIFKGFNGIVLGKTTVKELQQSYPNSRVEKIDFSVRIVYIDSLGLEVHCQKEALKNEYWAYLINVSAACPFQSKEGIRIGLKYHEIERALPRVKSENSSRITNQIHKGRKEQSIWIHQDSTSVHFYSDAEKLGSSSFIIYRIEIRYLINSGPISRSSFAMMGMPRIEFSSDFKSFSPFAGFGFYTTYFITGNLGAEFRFAKDSFFIGPKAFLGIVAPLWPGVQLNFSAFVPIKNNEYDIILNPQLGTNLFYGILYLKAGYNFNLYNNFDIPNSFNLTLGINFPMNLSKFVENI